MAALMFDILDAHASREWKGLFSEATYYMMIIILRNVAFQ